ncbi:MAG TPA: hypothetical protein VGX69_11835 [Solirubrobacteraceae bacterium]|jgi:hypothetical protein|nr:hypothetical protein [Solirubrobacteraceae bacterium]
MAAVDIDRQAIERRDFPIARRGYEPAAVDAHLRALASEIEELQRASGGSEPSLAATAGTQVQGILAAAEAAAAEIERQARESANATRERAEQDAASTREDAIAQARAHVAAVSQATAVLLERVGSMDGEVSALLESLRAGASHLASDLAALDANMGELYDAASGNAPTHAVASDAVARPAVPAPPPPPATPRPAASARQTPIAPASGAAAPHVRPAQSSPPPLAPDEGADPHVHVDPEAPALAAPTVENGDVDSARLVALNMALNGESREDAERYLAENYQLADRQKLIDEVFAAIEG